MADEQQHSFGEKFNLPFAELWAKYKVFFLVFGILVVVWKFREVIIDVLVSSSREAVKETQKQDTALRDDEQRANDQANQLRKDAEALSENKPKVDEDWYKK